MPDVGAPAVLVVPSSPNRHVVYSDTTWSQVGSGPIPKRARTVTEVEDHAPKRQRLSSGTPREQSASTADVEVKFEEDVINVAVPSDSFELSEQANSAFAVLKEEMYPVCSLHNMDILELVEEHKCDYGESLRDSVDLVSTDPTYNARCDRTHYNSDHDKFTVDDMKSMAVICRDVMKPGSHGHIFRTALQFCPWYRTIVKEVDDKEESMESQSASRDRHEFQRWQF